MHYSIDDVIYHIYNRQRMYIYIHNDKSMYGVCIIMAGDKHVLSFGPV
jgi:hypothetical protein